MKYHHFWKHVHEGYATVECATTENNADYLRMGLPTQSFEANQKHVQGW